MTPDVTVCIPAYKCEPFVREAIESVLSQTYEGFTLLISVDPSEDRSAEICLEYGNDPRVVVVENPSRLGWVGNVNACLDRITTPYFAFCFHDDTLEPVFLESLRKALEAAPGASAAFGAMQMCGTKDEIARPVDSIGTPGFRAKACLNGNFPAYSLKNLMRSEPVFRGLRLPIIGGEGFLADLPFALAFSLAGDFVAVSDLVYRKSHHTGSVTDGWRSIDVEEVAQNLTLVRLHLIRIVQSAGLDRSERQDLVLCILNRLNWQGINTAEDLHQLTDTQDMVAPAILIAELLEPQSDPTCLLVDPKERRSELAEHRLSLARRFRRLGEERAARTYAEQAARIDAHAADANIFLARLERKNSKPAARLLKKVLNLMGSWRD